MDKKYRYVVIDDDVFAAETLVDLLNEIPELVHLMTISESGMAIKHLATLKPDLVFLDVNMPNKNGIEIQKEILDLNLHARVVFTTAHEEYVLEAFKNKAFDYLVKPVSKNDLHETLSRFHAQVNCFTKNDKNNKAVNKQEQKEIVVKNAYGTLVLQCSDVFYIEAEGSYSNIHLINGKTELVSKNLGKIEHLFHGANFFKISRSCIINIKHLMKTDRLNKRVVLLCNNQDVALKISREKFYDLEHFIQSEVENKVRSI